MSQCKAFGKDLVMKNLMQRGCLFCLFRFLKFILLNITLSFHEWFCFLTEREKLS